MPHLNHFSNYLSYYEIDYYQVFHLEPCVPNCPAVSESYPKIPESIVTIKSWCATAFILDN